MGSLENPRVFLAPSMPPPQAAQSLHTDSGCPSQPQPLTRQLPVRTAVRHCFLPVLPSHVRAHTCTPTCMSQGRDHTHTHPPSYVHTHNACHRGMSMCAHRHALTYSKYLDLQEQSGGRRREEQEQKKVTCRIDHLPPQHQGPPTMEGLADPSGPLWWAGEPPGKSQAMERPTGVWAWGQQCGPRGGCILGLPARRFWGGPLRPPLTGLDDRVSGRASSPILLVLLPGAL